MMARYFWAAAAVLVGCPSTEPSCPSPPSPLAVVEAPKGDGQQLLADVAKRAAQAGASPLVVVAEGVAAEGDRVGGFVSLPGEGCSVVFARASKSVSDLDLFAYSDDGSAIATDESASADAAFVLCPPQPSRVYLVARVVSGSGVVALGAQQVSAESSVAAAVAVGARASGEESGRLESWPGLEAKVVAHRRNIGSSWEDIRRFAALLDARAPTRTTVAIEAGRCLDVLVVPADEVSSLDVVAETEDARVIARGAPDGRDRSMILCSEAGDEITIAARPRGGSGLAAFVIGRSPKGAAPEIEQVARIERVSQELSADAARAELSKQLDSAWGKGSIAGRGDARVGGRTSADVKLGAGCTRIDVIAGKPLGPVAASLWDAGAKLLSEAEGSARTTLYGCGATAARVDVESRGRPGPFVLDVRTWKEPPPDVMKRPVAAARLLDRTVGLEPTSPEVIEDARPIDLEADTLHSSSFVVAQGTCTEVFVALDAGSGIDLRLIDDATQEDVIGRGRFVASQRMCGGKSSRKSRLELRADVGPAPGLVLLRTTRE